LKNYQKKKNFIEVPEKMKVDLPELYRILCGMLNHDSEVFYYLNAGIRISE